ncbi:hypothetical protein C2S53_003496 [Perilla frutescens var. hirtella]|uniref:Glycosyltransferase 61 catalytic domain-containing protein n=1 Tax=Perilla frutescens var. hirtella TaxID=608512 RepID=A0AAD4P122_PERFH|nr:hypothetical protein C2S53_003496 [Perilla frutescens var. hirtella]
MEKHLVFRLTPWIFLLVIPLLYVDIMWGKNIRFEQRLHYISSPVSISSSSARKMMIVNPNKTVEENSDSLHFLLSRLVQEQDLKKFRATGFSCDTQVYSKHCVTDRATQIDTGAMTVTIPTSQPRREAWLRPYARQEDEILLKKVTPVKIVLGGNATAPPVCDHSHGVPAVVFSTSGFIGNVFHEINEIIIPLYITTAIFKKNVVLVVEDYRPSFMAKYSNVLAQLTSYEILNAAAAAAGNRSSVHCFSGAIVGLKFHGHLSLNASDIPRGLSTLGFKQFLRDSLHLKFSHVSQIKKPTVMLLSRRTTRRIINEEEVVGMMEDLGFRVVVVARAKVISNLELFSSMINSCSVFVGAHGAGLTNELFLPDGAVMVQVDLVGLEWAAATYYGNPARGMGVHYLRYKVEPEESSLLKIFGSRTHQAFVDPKGAFPVHVGREVYLNGQNVRINVERFRETMVEAMSLVRDEPM